MRSSEYELATENRILYEWIRDNGHAQFVQKASECDMFAYGEQCDPSTKAKVSRRNKPTLTLNRVLPAVSTLQGEYLNRRGDVAFRAAARGCGFAIETLATDSHSYADAMKALEQVIVAHLIKTGSDGMRAASDGRTEP
jgi:hypothetical protein